MNLRRGRNHAEPETSRCWNNSVEVRQARKKTALYAHLQPSGNRQAVDKLDFDATTESKRVS